MEMKCGQFLLNVIIMATFTQIVQAMTTVELRIDAMNASDAAPSTKACCNIGLCACRSRLRACVFERTQLSCSDSELQDSEYLGGLSLTRTPSVLAMETAETKEGLALRVQILYGPMNSQDMVVLGNYSLDLSTLPHGPNADQVGWATFDLDTNSLLRLVLQLKVYCSQYFYGDTCSHKCVPITSQYYCDERGQRVCLGYWSGELCNVENACLSFPCLNEGTCVTRGHSYVCMCNPLYTGPDCSLGVDSCSSLPCSAGSTCVDLVHNFTCLCPPGKTGKLCETDASDCRAHGCVNGGLCLQKRPSLPFACVCPTGFVGSRCQRDLCAPGVCANGGACRVTGRSSYVCDCAAGHRGQHCEVTSSCDPNPCQNNGRCYAGANNDFLCRCTGPFTGHNCQNFDPCASSPCTEHGHCVRQGKSDRFKCECHVHYTGHLCQFPNPCIPNPCLNSGTCTARNRIYDCTCPQGYFGLRCQFTEPCSSSPCQNGGTCKQNGSDLVNGYVCSCPPGFVGRTCTEHVACSSRPCANGGTCLPDGSAHFCRCRPGYSGPHCEFVAPCSSSPCKNGGSCYELSSAHVCVCPHGITGTFCETRIQDACSSNPCLNSGSCFQSDSYFSCACPARYTGTRCEDSLTDTCSSRRCLNGGSCYSSGSSAVCVCPREFLGDFCEIRNPCMVVSSVVCFNNKTCQGDSRNMSTPCGQKGICQPCQGGRSCSPEGRNYICACSPGYLGVHCDTVDPCTSSKAACPSGRICVPIPALNTFICPCHVGDKSSECEVKQPCFPNPCLNNGTCIPLTSSPTSPSSSPPSTYRCACTGGYTGMNCGIYDSCQKNPCSNNGTCVSDTSPSGESRVRCSCPRGYTGARCEQKVSCNAHPCLNHGECVPAKELSRTMPSGYLDKFVVCSCPHGYSGVFCETVLDCQSVPCLNRGLCKRNARGERYCACSSRFMGRFCETALTCDLAPCLNGGLCIPGLLNLDGGLSPPRCSCMAGFTGMRCEHAVVPSSSCDRIRCENGGSCIETDHKPGACLCRRGWYGDRCHLQDMGFFGECPENVCLNGGTCILARGMPTCVCPVGFSGSSCQTSSFSCSTNKVCLNGGTCVPRPLSTPPYECMCPTGYGGMHCQIRPMDPCTPNPCYNNGRCSVDSNVKGYVCKCELPFTGDNCEIKSGGSCLSFPCRNMGTCIELSAHSFMCRCLPGWHGHNCQTWSAAHNMCPTNYCSDRGVCYLGQNNSPACRCHQAFGERCEFTCGMFESDLLPHPAECTLYVSCVWGNPYVMQCPRQDLHFNPRLHICDWHAHAGCQSAANILDQEYAGVVWRITAK